MPWLVDIVQEVSDLPLSLDTTNVVAIEEGLEALQEARLDKLHLPAAGPDGTGTRPVQEV